MVEQIDRYGRNFLRTGKRSEIQPGFVIIEFLFSKNGATA